MSQRRGNSRRLVPMVSAGVIALVVITAFAAFWFLGERSIEGTVVDRFTAQPLANVSVTAAGQTILTDEEGRFAISGLRPGLRVEFNQEGYRAYSLVTGSEGTVKIVLDPYVLQGTVLDADSRSPIEGAVIRLGEHVHTTGPGGSFSLPMVTPGNEVVVEAPGYALAKLVYSGEDRTDIALVPNELRLKVVNAETGEVLKKATVELNGERKQVSESGEITLRRLLPDTELTISAPDYLDYVLTYSGQTETRVEMTSGSVTGRVADDEGNPIEGATVSAGDITTTTDVSGQFRLFGVPADATISVRKEGYSPVSIEEIRAQLDVVLRTDNVRALYLTYYGVGDDGLLQNALDLIERTEANALVIDVKGDRGWLAYRSKVPMVEQIGAQQEIMIPDIEEFMREMKKRDIYMIARIVVFKDNPLATSRPDLAVTDSVTGGLWIDNENLAWADASHEEVWDYNIALAVEAAELGFDEIQFDYVRFPTDASPGTSVDHIHIARENTMANRVASINGFLSKAKQALEPYGVLLAADVFGYVTWREDDMGIGQHLESLGHIVDVICPMVYPTLYWHGLPLEEGTAYYGNAPAYPYEIVHLSLQRAQERLEAAGATAILRPWLQYYNDYTMDIPYGDREVRVQKQAGYDLGIMGWMLWDPSNWYAKGGLEPASTP